MQNEINNCSIENGNGNNLREDSESAGPGPHHIESPEIVTANNVKELDINIFIILL